MSEVLLDVGVRYKQTYIPWRHRLEVDELLRKTHTVAIRTIAADAAPVAFRIHTISDDDCEDTGPSCSVRSFEGGVWWPLFDFNGPVSPREFTAAASQGTRRALTALGCTTDMEHPSALWEDDFEKKYLRCRLRETTFDSQRRLTAILGQPDNLKFRSSMTMFHAVSQQPLFADAIAKFFPDGPDSRTLNILQSMD